MKILITGSHFTPAQAVIEELKSHSGVEIVYLGRKHTREGDKTASIESQILPKLGVKFIPITSGRLQRDFTVYTIPSLLKIPVGFIQSLYYLLMEKPTVILSFGGYNALPAVIWGWLLSIPIIIHEQTMVSGLSNKLSSYFANKIAISFPNHEFSKLNKSVLTGNPLRRELLTNPIKSRISKDIKAVIDQANKEKLPLILITGGNQGSHLINETVLNNLEELTKIACFIHQTGDSKLRDFERLAVKQQSSLYSKRYIVRKWIDVFDLAYLFPKLQLAVARAGANTLLELAYFQIPTLLIPIPYLYKDEQNTNARFFKQLGLAEILPQSQLNGQNLLCQLKLMIKDLPVLKKGAQKARAVVISDAAKRVALETILLASCESY